MLHTARAASLLAAVSLFLLQPLVARALVPLYGGTSWVWIAVSVFFQLSLIFGYIGAAKLSIPGRARIHSVVAPVALLFAAVGFWLLMQRTTFDSLPIEPAVFLHLALTVGAVAVYLAMASPLLQISIEADGRIDAHRLYAWSNAGSLAGLLLYPIVMESFVPLRYQMAIWLAVAVSAAFLIHRTVAHTEATAAPQPIQWRFPGRGRVVFTSAVAGALTIAVTARLTLDLGAVPLLWVMPLVVLLLSYIVAFGNLSWQRSLTAAGPMALAMMCYIFFNAGDLATAELLVLWCGLLFVVQCGLQSQIRMLAPTGGARGSFYVSLAVGGFAGSLIVGCLVPYYFNAASMLAATPLTGPILQPILGTDPIPELGWSMVAAAFALVNRERWKPRDLVLAAVIGAIAVFLFVNDAYDLRTAVTTAAVAYFGAMAMSYLPAAAGRPWLFAATVTLIVLASSLVPQGKEMFRTRNVYGVLIAKESGDGTFTELFHGTTIHGMQNSVRTSEGIVKPTEPLNPLTYFHTGSPIGHVFKSLSTTGCPLRVGIIGLGAGTLAAYARSGDDFEFYEIDPGSVVVAEGPHFSYLAAARERGARISIVVGDGRQTLMKRTGPKLDLIVVDAFSSDAIPAHLLTMEAFQVAESQLAPGGYLAFHVSNRYFSVDRVVTANANRLGWAHVAKHGDGAGLGTASSDWVIVRPHDVPASGPCGVNLVPESKQATAATPVWTDEFSNPLALLRSRGIWSRLKGEKRGPAKPVYTEGTAPTASTDRSQSPGQ
jgi:hypothetical protein